ncbi:MAG: TetR family transcriptional regulator [Pseudanabaena frigida]|uniref:TetR family transcriptional regulator n=1 Tax=Pseudanabaena frigida TaxID=945775 RepID=A0A2W4W8S6_9CYAN|nr:MAG: TetR family transcriptional regulator [Pseudanabaena frigida]
MTKAKPVERELSSKKTELILEGAMQEFLEHGYAGARIDRIVEAAGVSKATVYRHFPDKEALFTAIIQQMSCRKTIFELQSQQSFEESPSVFLKQYASKMLDNVAEDPQVLTFLRIIVGESGRFPELARAFVINIEKVGLEFLTQYLTNHPQLQIADPEVTARVFIGTLIHFVILRDVLQSGDLVPIERDRLLDSLLNLIVSKNEVSL